MRALFGSADAVTREIGGQFVPGRDTLVPPSNFPAVARVLWPEKTAAQLAVIGGKDERTAKRWLSGEYDVPMEVVLATIDKIFRRGA